MNTAKSILAERLAKGEITEEEYKRLSTTISSPLEKTESPLGYFAAGLIAAAIAILFKANMLALIGGGAVALLMFGVGIYYAIGGKRPT